MDDVQGLAVVLPRVGVVQALGQLHHHPHALLGQKGLARLQRVLDDVLQVVALDVFHRDVVAAVLRIEIVNLNDIRVLQLRGDGRLVDEHLDEVLILREVRQDPLDHDGLLEALGAGRLRTEDLRHPPHRDATKEHVLSVPLRQVLRHRPHVRPAA